jgi:hypothetical protein
MAEKYDAIALFQAAAANEPAHPAREVEHDTPVGRDQVRAVYLRKEGLLGVRSKVSEDGGDKGHGVIRGQA